MNERDDLDRLMTAWFKADAPLREPEPMLGQVLARTVRTRRRPAWRIPERWIPMSTISTRVAATSRFPWRTAGAVALLILALLAGAWVISGSRSRALPAPFGPADNGRLAYSVNGDIVAADSPTAPPRTILGGSTFDSGPLFSPNGARLIFVGGQIEAPDAELWTADADGSNPRRLMATPQISLAEWSPRSDVVAVSLHGDRSVIRMVKSDGSGSAEIKTGLLVAENPVFRPSDGAQMTFRGEAANGTWGLYLIGRDGTGMQRLDLDPGFAGDDYYAENSAYYFFGPAWSPDGTKLMYHTLEPDPTSIAGPGFRIHIADVSPSGAITAERKLEFDRSADDESDASWLPRGDGIVFQTLEGALARLMVADIRPGSKARDLGLTGTSGIGYLLSPDGRQVMSSSTVGSNDRTISMTDLVTLQTTKVEGANDDWSWQRTAP